MCFDELAELDVVVSDMDTAENKRVEFIAETLKAALGVR